LFQGGKFSAEDAATTSLVLSIIVAGLPAYVLIKVLTPGFYARKDMKTPVYIAIAALVLAVGSNFALVPVFGISALAFTTAASAWLNALALYLILRARGHYRIPGLVWWRSPNSCSQQRSWRLRSLCCRSNWTACSPARRAAAS
jgi:putative peptidoglycan lipid II flippase